MMTTLEKVGESIVLTFNDGTNQATVMLSLDAAARLGHSLIGVVCLGADQLDGLLGSGDAS